MKTSIVFVNEIELLKEAVKELQRFPKEELITPIAIEIVNKHEDFIDEELLYQFRIATHAMMNTIGLIPDHKKSKRIHKELLKLIFNINVSKKQINLLFKISEEIYDAELRKDLEIKYSLDEENIENFEKDAQEKIKECPVIEHFCDGISIEEDIGIVSKYESSEVNICFSVDEGSMTEEQLLKFIEKNYPLDESKGKLLSMDCMDIDNWKEKDLFLIRFEYENEIKSGEDFYE